MAKTMKQPMKKPVRTIQKEDVKAQKKVKKPAEAAKSAIKAERPQESTRTSPKKSVGKTAKASRAKAKPDVKVQKIDVEVMKPGKNDIKGKMSSTKAAGAKKSMKKSPKKRSSITPEACGVEDVVEVIVLGLNGDQFDSFLLPTGSTEAEDHIYLLRMAHVLAKKHGKEVEQLNLFHQGQAIFTGQSYTWDGSEWGRKNKVGPLHIIFDTTESRAQDWDRDKKLHALLHGIVFSNDVDIGARLFGKEWWTFSPNGLLIYSALKCANPSSPISKFLQEMSVAQIQDLSNAMMHLILATTVLVLWSALGCKAGMDYVLETGRCEYSRLLRHAACEGQDELMKRVLQYKALHDVFHPIELSRALGNAASYNHISTARLLLEAGASVEYAEPYYVAPLHLAVDQMNLAMVRLLLKHGARLDTPYPCDGKLPYQRALLKSDREWHQEIVELLRPTSHDTIR